MKDHKTCTVVLVNYFNEKDIVFFVRNYLIKQKALHSILIVDNGSNEIEKLNNLTSEYSNVFLLEPGKNLGYLGGFVFAIANRPVELPDWLALSNSDIEFSNEKNINQMILECENQDYVLVGPTIISSRTQHNQNPFYGQRISLFKLKILRIIFKSYILYFIYQLIYNIKSKLISIKKKNNNNEIDEVYSVHGSFLLMRNSFIQMNIENLKRAPFLFGEEIYLAELAFAAGKKAAIVNNVVIFHHEHATTGLFKTRKMLKLLKQSMDFLYHERKQINTDQVN